MENQAAEGYGYIENWLNGMDLDTVQASLCDFFPQTNLNLDALLSMIMNGKVLDAVKMIAEHLGGGLTGELQGIKQIFMYLLILGIVSALFSEFSDLFAGQQISQAGFYFLYLFLMVILTKVFLFVSHIASETISNIVLFIKLFIPTYFLAIGVAQGANTAVFYYQLMLLIAYLVENFLCIVLLPFIYSYVMLALLNGLWAEEKLTLLLEFIKKGIILSLKIAMGAVTGLSMVQAVILPVLDRLKLSAIRKAALAIPGIGGIAEGITELVLGAAVLLKNSMGILFVVLMIGICLVPICKILLVTGTIKLGAAMTGIVSDKRISSCCDRVGEGCFLLFRCVFTAIALFIIVIAIIAYQTAL